MYLTGSTMTQLAIQRLLPAQLIFDPSTMAVGLILDIEARLFIVHLVGRTLLPLTDALGAFALILGLVTRHSVDV